MTEKCFFYKTFLLRDSNLNLSIRFKPLTRKLIANHKAGKNECNSCTFQQALEDTKCSYQTIGQFIKS